MHLWTILSYNLGIGYTVGAHDITHQVIDSRTDEDHKQDP